MNAFLGVVGASVGSSTVIWGVIQWVLTAKERRDKRASEQKAEKLRDEHEVETRSKLLAEAQAISQTTALESANQRYLTLQGDYESVRKGLKEVRQASGLLINAFEGFLLRLRPNEDGKTYSAIIDVTEVDLARRTIMEARDHLF
jgi:hypothetical protein